MTEAGRIIVVGASMAGMRAAEAARKAGFTGELVVFGEEPHLPYNRPPLSKDVLAGRQSLESLMFRLPRAASDISWRLNTTVTAADLKACTVTTADGETLGYDGLVIATGLRPRRLTLPGPMAGRHVLRTIEDVQSLQERLQLGIRLAIVGAGFIGCELAATAIGLGAEVTVIAPEPVPMQRPLGDLLGADLQHRHSQQGVQFRLGRMPVEFLGDGNVEGLRLDDGTELSADLVVEAIGCAPNVEWLQGNNLDLGDGVECLNTLQVIGFPNVVACGDVSRFPNPLFDDVPRRVEHWTMVTDTAKRAGRTLGRLLNGDPPDDVPFTPVPSFWSDQYQLRIQSFGAVGLGAQDVRVLDGAFGSEVVVGYHRDDALIGVAMIGFGGKHRSYHDIIAGLAA